MIRNVFVSSALVALFVPAMAQPSFSITAFGASTGSSNNALAIQQAIDSLEALGGGVLEVPAGTFKTGTLVLCSNLTLRLQGTLQGTGNPSDYPDLPAPQPSRADGNTQRSLLVAFGQHNIRIEGPGTLDGNGQSLSFLLADSDERPYNLRFHQCTNLQLHGLQLRNSGFWMMHLFDCDTVLLDSVTVYNHGWGNNDGLSFDCCRHVRVHDCSVDSNNDPLVFKGMAPKWTDDVLAERCTLRTFTRAIKIGTETNGYFRNITVRQCTVGTASFGNPTGAIKADCGINLAIVDGGSMENVTVENIVIEDVETALMLRLGNRATPFTDTAATPGVGSIRSIWLRNIRATQTTNITSHLTGIPGHRPDSITLQNIQLTIPGGQPALPAGFPVPENEPDKPEHDMFGTQLPSHGLYVRHLGHLVLDSVCIVPLQPDGRPTFALQDVSSLDSLNLCPHSLLARKPNASGPQAVQPWLWPNPARHQVHLAWPGQQPAQVSIFNALGQPVHQASLQPNQALPFGLPAGTYWLELQTPTHRSAGLLWVE